MDRVPTRVIVYYPRGSRTGGPEALHQLVDTLRAIGTESYLTPIVGSQNNPRVPEYSHYDAPEIDRVLDADDVAVVVPETYPHGLVGLRHAQRFCWWLSVDNSPAFMWRSRSERGALSELYGRLRSTKWARQLTQLQRSGLNHLAQSHYAWAFLNSEMGIVSSLLSDYTVLDARESSRSESMADRMVVSYNPAKGGDYVSRLRRRHALDVEWLAIESMTPAEVAAALRRSAIYLDLGHHPGKDRLPREAAISGALTLVARRGAGAYAADVPIPLQHKIPVEGDMVFNAAAVMARAIPQLRAEVRRQEFYRSVIRAERDAFTRQVRNVFQAGLLGLDLDIPGVKLPDTE